MNDAVKKIVVTLLTGWMVWMSYSMVELQKHSTLIEYKMTGVHVVLQDIYDEKAHIRHPMMKKR